MQNSSTIRWAILGAGRIAHKFASDFKEVNNAALVAVASRDKQKATEFAAQYNIPEAISYDELYLHSGIDAVYIATTHNFHFEQSLSCLNHGKAVLCEKPITINALQFQTLAEVAKRNNCYLMEAMWTWFLPAIQQAKKWIDDGRIGEIKAIQSDFGALMPFDPSGRLYNANLAGGALLDLGVYPVAITTFITGKEPLHIYSSGQIGTTGVDETNSIILDYGEIKASLVTSMVAQMQNKAIIFGNKGYIEIPDFYKAYSATLYNSERKEIETFSDNRSTWGYNYETQAVTNDLLEGIKENEIVSLEKTAIVQQILTTVKKQIGLIHPGD